ncbi:MAG: transcription elongation protein SprT [Cyclobacteriaceae bacterium]
MSGNKGKDLFEKHVPSTAVDYCYQLWLSFDFNLRITKKRNSKLGDYKFDPATTQHSISVNHNLNKYSFLITYIHEVAHLTTKEKYPRKVSPHGREWKNEFRKLMLPILNDKIFPDGLLRALASHMRNPKASSTSDKLLYKALMEYDENNGAILLAELEIGSTFLFNKRIYKKLEKRRTRSLCVEMKSNKKYLVSETASVKPFKN